MLNVGTAQGVRKGMEFYVYLPSTSYDSAQITNVDGSYAEAEIIQYKAEKVEAPSPGWKLSTHFGSD